MFGVISYGRFTEHWLERCAEHKKVIALIFARTETKMFRKFIWEKAKAVLFIYGRISFYHVDGKKIKILLVLLLVLWLGIKKV